MAKQFFKNLPDTSTPLTATRFNGLLDGDESQGNLVVDSIRSKNMFDKSTIVAGDITATSSTIRLSSRQILWLEAGTYTFSCNMTSPFRWGVQVQNAGIPPLADYPTYIYNSSWQSYSVKEITFTIQTSGWFILSLSKENNAALTVDEVKNFNYQLEKGSTATAYSPHQNLNGENYYLITDNNWKVKKYADGTFEAWYPYTNTNTTTATGTQLSPFYNTSSITITGPSLVSSIYDYRVNASFTTTNSWPVYWLVSGTFNLRYQIITSSSITTNTTYRQSAYMAGRWD